MKLAEICQVTEVQDHPNSEKAHLGVFILNNGAQLIGVNNEDGSRRFKVDDLLIHVKPGAIIPEKIINSGFENIKNGKVKASNFAGVRSEGIMLNVSHQMGGKSEFGNEPFSVEVSGDITWNGLPFILNLGDDATELLGIKSV